MKPSPEQIEEARKRGIAEGAVIYSAQAGRASGLQVVESADNWRMIGNSINNGSGFYLYWNGKWAEVYTPAPQAEVLKGNVVCECGPAMRRAIVDMAKEKGLAVGGVSPESKGLDGVRLDEGSRVVTNAGGHAQLGGYTLISPGEFYDRLCAMPKAIRIGDHTVEFKDGGDIKVGCTRVDFSTLEAVYNKAKAARP